MVDAPDAQIPPMVNPPQVVHPISNYIAPVSVRPPIFWKANPRIWFCQIEAQFANARITSDLTKYNTVVSSLDGAILSQVSDVILNPPNVNLYVTLKSKLLERFEESEQSRLNTLLTSLTLGDKKPTHLLRQMRELAGGNIGDSALKSLFLQRLPHQAQAMFSISDQSLDQIANLADRFIEVTSCSVAAVQVNTADTTDQITSVLQKLTLEVAALKANSNNASFNRARTHFRARSTSKNNYKNRSTSRASSDVCWYHKKFGDKAKKCSSPCNFVKSEN